jgi:hypothetical protein
MLLGHIDLVDRETVRGWAADTDRPYGTVEIAVFVDGRLTGLARADQARDDLKDPTALGDGAHGVTYQFDPPLSWQQDHDVVVRFAEGSRLLGQWRVARAPEGWRPPEAAPSQADATAEVPTDAAPASAAPASGNGSGALPRQVLVGYLDVCTCEGLSGWAASKTNPDEVLDISIFIDDRKVAQVTCNLPRQDLAKAGTFGDGARAFVYRFDPPVPDVGERHVAVVHARTGLPLSEGDVLFTDGKVKRLTPPDALAENEPRLLPPPSEPRAMFDWLGLYDEQGGLAQLLSRLEFGGQRPEGVHFAVFGAHPKSVEDVLRWGAYYPRDHLHELLLSDDFQTGLIPLFLRAFPEKRRLIFVHIPKCAGTDLTFHFRGRHPSLDRSLTAPDWTSKPAMLRRIARVVAHVRTADSIFVHGHINLADHIDTGIIRPTDRAFTVIRDPLAAAISQINYILTRFEQDISTGQLRPDTRQWSQTMDLGAVPERVSDAFVRHVTHAALRDVTLTVPNALCRWLGDGGAQHVVERLASHDIEVTDVERYNAWLRAAWGIEATTRWNESKKFISIQDLATDDLGHLSEVTRDDQRLYRTVEGILTASGKLSLHGDDLRGASIG